MSQWIDGARRIWSDRGRTGEACGRRPRRSMLVVAAVGTWGLVAGASLLSLIAYSRNAGRMGPPDAAQAPAMLVGEYQYTLVVAVHPRCPCTRASLFELQRLMARCGGRLGCRVLVVRPAGAPQDWEATDIVRTVRRLPRTEVELDADGKVARSLGCETSGSVVLLDAAGAPRFWGGITASRGHAGDNPGSDSIAAIVFGRHPGRRTTPVFGCDLVGGQPSPPVRACCGDGS